MKNYQVEIIFPASVDMGIIRARSARAAAKAALGKQPGKMRYQEDRRFSYECGNAWNTITGTVAIIRSI